jgi:bidirectional [NiFe] hydrogenase diaphorase subunit
VQVRFKLDGRIRDARKGVTVLEAARDAGVDIPAVCAHEAVAPYGACRLCVVEVREKGKRDWRVVASCLYPVEEGLEVRTCTDRIKRYRRVLLEMMLARCPDVPYVRKLARSYGVRRTRFAKGDSDCIVCGLCVRVCSEVVGACAVGFSSRGVRRRIEVPFGIDSSRCIACGACTYVCPTGAIQMEYERVIELRRQEGEHLCRYTMMGILSGAVCSLNYECARCEIDQKMWERFGTHPAIALKSREGGKAASFEGILVGGRIGSVKRAASTGKNGSGGKGRSSKRGRS